MPVSPPDKSDAPVVDPKPPLDLKPGDGPIGNDGKPIDPRKVEGFHVIGAKSGFLGTYPTEEDAQAYIDGQLTPQDIKASVVEGHAEAETE